MATLLFDSSTIKVMGCLSMTFFLKAKFSVYLKKRNLYHPSLLKGAHSTLILDMVKCYISPIFSHM